MDDLARWLGQQLDEDERIARAAEGDPVFDGTGIVIERNRARGFPDRVAGLISPVATHIAVWGPARVLREIDAKRDLLRFAEGIHDHHETFTTGVAARLEQTLRLFALAYADRPGFREEWAL